MFRKTIFTSILSMVGILAAWLFLTLHVSEKDRKRFREMQQKGHAIAAAAHRKPTQQNRFGVRKDLWIVQEDGQRLHDRIESTCSTLTLTPMKDHLDILENLSQIQCSMQDKIVQQDGKWIQQVRHFYASTGVYQYSTSQFTAQSAELSLFRLPGKDLPKEFAPAPYLKGVAQDVSFAVAGKASQFQAKHFKASFVGQKDD